MNDSAYGCPLCGHDNPPLAAVAGLPGRLLACGGCQQQLIDLADQLHQGAANDDEIYRYGVAWGASFYTRHPSSAYANVNRLATIKKIGAIIAAANDAQARWYERFLKEKNS